MAARGSVLKRGIAIAACAAFLLLAVGLPMFATRPARGLTYTLYGHTLQGWGLTPTTITSPGPTLIVTQGEPVDLVLFSADSGFHTWCIDYGGDGSCTPGVDDETAPFSSPTTPHVHTLIPGAPGTYTYICGVHLGAVMNGLIRINPPTNPTVAISSPTGSQRWTGGSAHPIEWTMMDPNDPVTALRAWVNYSTTGSPPWVPIAGPIQGTANPHTVAWTLPVVNATSAAVNVTVVDTTMARAWAVRGIPVIDSTPPSVVGRIPGNGATGISTATNVIVAFSEAMNRAATAQPMTAAFQDLTTTAWVPVTYSWGPGDMVLTLNPDSNLAPNTDHWVIINTTAKDASDPGIALPAADAWMFRTGSGADIAPPQISNVAATPPVAEAPAPVSISATITDDTIVAAAYANITFPDATRLNRSMAIVTGSVWGWSQSYPLLGSYLFRVDAVDSSGNWNRSSQGTFSVDDTRPPTISGLSAAPSPAEVFETVNITATVADPYLIPPPSVVVNGTNASMSSGSIAGTWYHVFTPMAVQVYTFVVWAGDTRGHFASASGTVSALDTTPPDMPTGLTATLVGNGVELQWNGVSAPDLAGYRLFRSASPTGSITTQVGPATIAGTVYRDTTVQPGVAYRYAVTAVDTGGRESMQSSVASVTIPSAPADLTLAVIAGVAIAVIVAVLAAAVLLLRRRRPKEPEP